jgi:hypothetical protein
MTRIGYFFLSRNDRLYYISIYDFQYAIIDIYRRVAIEFTSLKPLKPREIEDFIAWMESQGRPVYLHDALKQKLYAIALRIYTYEPKKRRKSIEVGEKA